MQTQYTSPRINDQDSGYGSDENHRIWETFGHNHHEDRAHRLAHGRQRAYLMSTGNIRSLRTPGSESAEDSEPSSLESEEHPTQATDAPPREEPSTATADTEVAETTAGERRNTNPAGSSQRSEARAETPAASSGADFGSSHHLPDFSDHLPTEQLFFGPPVPLRRTEADIQEQVFLGPPSPFTIEDNPGPVTTMLLRRMGAATQEQGSRPQLFPFNQETFEQAERDPTDEPPPFTPAQMLEIQNIAANTREGQILQAYVQAREAQEREQTLDAAAAERDDDLSAGDADLENTTIYMIQVSRVRRSSDSDEDSSEEEQRLRRCARMDREEQERQDYQATRAQGGHNRSWREMNSPPVLTPRHDDYSQYSSSEECENHEGTFAKSRSRGKFLPPMRTVPEEDPGTSWKRSEKQS